MPEKEPKNKKLSLEPYKGVRDFYPTDEFIQNYIFGMMRKTAESFGYVEYAASILEPSELYRSKTSEEIANEQTYTFTDRGGREVTLRPEMTPTIARMIAAKAKEISFPVRWYSIANCFRYERPQRGRVREHWQLNCDLFGLENQSADIEIIALAYQILKNFGLKDENFEIRVNSRKLLKEIFESKIKDPTQIPGMFRLLDKKSKMKAPEFEAEWQKLFGSAFPALETKPNEKLEKVISDLKQLGIPTKFDPELVRGFDYYNDIVFEIFDTNPGNNRSIFGGGRYDNLLQIFDEKPVPAVGFGMGDVVIRDVLETYGLLPTYRPTAKLYLCPADENSVTYANILAQRIRLAGINVAVDYTSRKIGDQIKYADKNKIPFISVIGEDEIKTGKIKIKRLLDGKESEVESENSETVVKILKD